MIIVDNPTGSNHFVGLHKFIPGEHEYHNVPDVVVASLKNSKVLKVKDLTDLRLEEEVPITPDELVNVSKDFEALDTSKASEAINVIVDLADKALLKLLAQKAQFVTVRRAAQDRLKLLEELSQNASEKPN